MYILSPEVPEASGMLQSMMSGEKSSLVYSTNRVLPAKEKPAKQSSPVPGSSQQKISVRLDRKGRGGKSVTLIEGLQMPEQEREALLKEFKTKLGTGGTLRNGVIEIQGDHRDSLIGMLQGMGYNPKRAGG